MHGFTEWLQNIKTGIIVAATTAGSGLGTILDLIPNEIGKLATLIGMLLSITIIYVHITRIRMEKAREQRAIERELLELELLKQKIKNRESLTPEPPDR